MNYTTAIFLVNDAVRAVAVSYQPLAQTGPNGERLGERPFYTFKTLDPSIKVGDFVTIPTDTRWTMTTARVEEVDLDVDFDSDVQLKWIVGRVATEDHAAILAAEADAVTKIRSAEKKRKQDELRAKLIADNPALADLAHVETITALPAPE